MADSSFFLESGVFYPFDSSSGNIGGGGTLGHLAIWAGSNLLGSAGAPSLALLDTITGLTTETGVLQRTGAGAYAFLGINGANGLVQLTAASKLPAIDGSLLTNLTAGALSGALPALNGAALTSLTAANLLGPLPAISGAALTAIPPLTGEVTTSALAATITKSITPTWTGLHTFNGGLTSHGAVNFNGTGTFPQTLTSTANLSGSTLPAGNGVWLLNIASDTANVGNAFGIGINITHMFGGSAVIGGRAPIYTALVLNGATNAANPNRNYIGGSFTTQAQTGDGGTNLTTDAKGAIFGFASTGWATSGATNLLNVTGGEIDFGLYAGSSAKYKTGLQIAQLSSDAVAGSALDALLALTSEAPATGLNFGLVFSDFGSAQPVKSTGTLIGISNPNSSTTSVANGVDFSAGVFSGNAFASPSFSVNGTGDVAANSVFGSNGTYLDISSPHVPAQGSAIFLGNSADPTIFLRATTITLQNLAASSSYVSIGASGLSVLTTTTVSALPSASTNAGKITRVSDGTAALAVGATVTGGGSTPYLVWSNGTNWTVLGK